MELEQKIALVTGGAVRVGRAISKELAKSGALVCCHYHSSEKEAQRLKKEIREYGGKIDLFRADLSKVASVKNLVQAIIQKYGQIDILINNAALFLKTPFGSVNEDQWDTLLNLNLKATFFLSQEVSRFMLKEQSGKIINIADSGALKPFPSYLPYSISKAGVVALTTGLAKALAPHIQVNCINPGPVLFPQEFADKEKEFAVNQTLLKRAGSAEDVARTVRFLIEGSDYITGACIPVDGGRSAR